jgi:uncharacterized SAM-binding protein YcdF (DUF218 family)
VTPLRLLRWVLRGVAALVVLLLLVVLGTAVRVWQVAREDSRDHADAIVVLGASQFDGRPSPVFASRLDHAKALYDLHVAAALVTVGGNKQGDRFTEAGAGASYLRSRGVPREAVAEVAQGRDTLTSLRAVAALAHDRAWHDVVIVTDPWHSFRARSMAGEVGLHAETSPTRSGPAVQGRARELRYIARETVAYLYYRVFGRGPGHGPAAV